MYIHLPALMISTLSITCLTLIFLGLKKILQQSHQTKGRQRRLLFIPICFAACWLILLGILACKGFFSDFSSLPPRPVLVILIPLPIILLISFSKPAGELLKIMPPEWLIFFQAFRIVVELVLFTAYLNEILPEQMTFGGRNFDIITGLLALPVGYYCFIKKSWPRFIAVIFNIAGLLLLINVLIIAMLSMPVSFRYFMNEPSTGIVGTFPFIYLPGVLVVLAYSLHIFSLRQLFLVKKV